MRQFIVATSACLLLAACSEAPPAATDAETASVLAPSEIIEGVPPLDAAGVPRLRPGLYDVVETDDASGSSKTKQKCVSEAANEDVRTLLTTKLDPDCLVSRSTDGKGLHFRSVCLQDGMQNALKLTVAGSDTRYRMQLAVSTKPPNGEERTTAMTAVGRRVGDCPGSVAPVKIVEPSALKPLTSASSTLEAD